MAVESTISQIQSTQSVAAEAANKSKSSGSSELGKDEFLKLLTEQMKHQDPTQPMDNTAFVAQLAQFSTLEQMDNSNQTLTKMLAGQVTALQTTAASYVGKSAVFKTDEVSIEKGGKATITADLAEAAADVSITIKDANGNTVRTEDIGSQPAGKFSFDWDGYDKNGEEVASGTYTVAVAAQDKDKNAIAVSQTYSSKITGISFDSDGNPTFHAGGTTIGLSDITELDE